MEHCRGCRCTSAPEPSRKVSLSSLSKSFNHMVGVDYLFLDGLRVFHVMDSSTRFSSGLVCDETAMVSSTTAFPSPSLSPFSPPAAIPGDQPFNNEAFPMFLRDHSIECRPAPPRRHYNNVIPSKHGIIRNVNLRLCTFGLNLLQTLAAKLARGIRNYLYRSSFLSAFKLAKGYFRPLTRLTQVLPEEVYEAHKTLQARRKFTRILRSKEVCEISLFPGDLFEVFTTSATTKHGKWRSPRLFFDDNRA